MFDPDRFIADCRSASAASGSPGVREVVSAAVSAPAEIRHALGEPRRAGVNVLHKSPELTILNLIWGTQMCQLPHDHRMWAVIGIYTGREATSFGGSQQAIPVAGSRPPEPKHSASATLCCSGPTSSTPSSILSGVLRGRSTCMEATSSRQHTVNGTLNASWKSLTTSSDCWRSSRSRTGYISRHDVRYRGLHNPAVERTRFARRSPRRWADNRSVGRS
jgi:hypothetical protein